MEDRKTSKGRTDAPLIYYDHDPDWIYRESCARPFWSWHSQFIYRDIFLMLKRLLPLHAADVLDVGCGAGQCGNVAAEFGYRYKGVEASAAAVALGRKTWPGLDLEVVDFAIPDVELNDKYPVIISINVLHCLLDPDHRFNFFTNLRNNLAPGGIVILTTMCAPVSDGFRQSRNPRIYLSVEEITHEIDKFLSIASVQFTAPRLRAKIGNCMVIAKG